VGRFGERPRGPERLGVRWLVVCCCCAFVLPRAVTPLPRPLPLPRPPGTPRHLRLEPPDPGDWAYAAATLERELRRLGAPAASLRRAGPRLAVDVRGAAAPAGAAG
jgi:hypothetical protein